MAAAKLEHVNITVSDPKATAAWMERIFQWKTRWEGPGMGTGYSIHVGEDQTYIAVFSFGEQNAEGPDPHHVRGGLNHVALVVDDLDAIEDRVKAEGFIPKSHADYEPGRRFYFEDSDGIEFELVQYG